MKKLRVNFHDNTHHDYDIDYVVESWVLEKEDASLERVAKLLAVITNTLVQSGQLGVEDLEYAVELTPGYYKLVEG